MAYKNIDSGLSEDDVLEIKEALSTIQEKLPFLVNLLVQKRRRALKMGDKSLAFVTNSLLAAQSNPDILPGSFDIETLDRDYRLSRNLTEVLTGLKQLTEKWMVR